MNIQNYIKLFSNIYILEKDEIMGDVNLKNCVKKLESIKSLRKLSSSIDVIYIGHFDDLIEKGVTAAFSDGCIYISNDCPDDETFVTEVVHEIGHATEKEYVDFIYDDRQIEKEFLTKRQILKQDLEAQGYSVPHNFLTQLNYDSSIDKFLFQDVGYDQIWPLMNGVFLNPYSATCVREYWCSCFEHALLRDKNTVAKLCPSVFNKLEAVLEM